MPSSSSAAITDTLSQSDIMDMVAEDMQRVDETIQKRLYSDVALVNQLSAYIINSGGKRLRPRLALLSAHACGYTDTQHVLVAAIIEFIHTATLLHDDVVDASELRRGKETANALFGNEASVLVGDFLYSRSFQMMVNVNDMRVMDILAETTNVIAEGEVMQLMNCNDPDTTEQQYIDVIQSKTAKLFEAATRLGAVLAKQPDNIEDDIARYGMHLGTAFQLIDDALDYDASANTIGKNVGDDLAEGKPTLPLIHAMQNCSNSDREIIRNAIENGGLEQIDTILAIIESTHSIAYTRELARREADHAIACLGSLDSSPYQQALAGLANFAVDRAF